MALENFNTYTEVDDDGDITRTATKCDVVTMRRDANSYVYKDMGVGHFGDFEHKFTTKLVSGDLNSGIGVWGLSNGYHTEQDKNVADDGFQFKIRCGSVSGYYYYLDDYESGTQEYWAGSVDTLYYCTAKRAGTALTVDLYTDASRETLAHSLEVVCNETLYRYIETIQSRDHAPTDAPAITGYVENLDLQEAAAAHPRSWGVIF